MKIFQKITDIQEFVSDAKRKSLSIGFVPTMGALHRGHLSLINRSKEENGITVCSIFVNPIQFNDKNDLDRYPRPLEKDIEILRQERCDAVFTPDQEEIYPAGESGYLDIDFGTLETVMEGAFRKNHFKGVATVVHKLFTIIPADRAYFGVKDFQQLAIIKYLVKITRMNVRIVACETVREPDGLALSSRNVFLTEEERNEAPLICQTMTEASKKENTLSPLELKKWINDVINKSNHLRTEYVEIADSNSLQPLMKWSPSHPARIFIAVKAGKIRLIDNMALPA